MAYWVLNEDGQAVAIVRDSDPDIQRILKRAGESVIPALTPGLASALALPHHTQTTSSRRPALAKPLEAAPPQLRPPHKSAQTDWSGPCRVRHVPSGRFLPEGLDPKDKNPAKTYNSLRAARAAVAYAANRGFAAKTEYEIVPATDVAQAQAQPPARRRK